MAARRPPIAWLLVLAFVVVPLVEIYVLIQVGQVIGAWWTIGLLIADSALGAWLVKREGRRAWAALSAALQRGRMPSTEIADGALILIGGTLILSPGFVLDLLGIVLILPFTRPLFRGVLARAVTRRLSRPGSPADRSDPRAGEGPGRGSRGPVVRGEVVEE